MKWRTFHQRETSVHFDVTCQPLVESFQHTTWCRQWKVKYQVEREWIYGGHGTIVMVALMCPVQICSPTRRTQTLTKTTGSPHPVCFDSVCIWIWSKQIPHPTEECNFGFWNRCHMEPVNKINSINITQTNYINYIGYRSKVQENAQTIHYSKFATRHFLWLLLITKMLHKAPLYQPQGLSVIIAGRYAEDACLCSKVLGCIHTWEEISMTKDSNLSHTGFISTCWTSDSILLP